jgi:Carboxypeptidase regulatory-like domain
MCNRRPVAVSQSTRCVAGLFLGLLLLAVLSPAIPASGRQLDPRKPYALIFGTVWGPDDRPVYGVKVRIRRADQKKAKWELYSNHNGEFAQRLPAGKADYVVRADIKGLKSWNGKKLEPGPEVTVHIEADERADIGLHLK